MTNLIGTCLFLFLSLQVAHADAFDFWSWLRPNTVEALQQQLIAKEESCRNKIMDHLQNIVVLERGRKDYYVMLERSAYRKTVRRCNQQIRVLEQRIRQLQSQTN